MYANVVVLTYQPPDIPTYSYIVPKELKKEIKIGQLVSVPFGKRNPMGVVIATRPALAKDSTRSDLKENLIKPISSVILQKPLLLPYQIELLKWMAFYFHAPMVNCLEAMIPEIPKRLMESGHRPALQALQALQGSALQAEQRIILVPSISRIPETLAKYPQAKNYAVYHHELKSAERFNTWQKILSQNTDYIFGSRSAIFTPCPNLKEIIIYDEHDQGYKDERSPYYNTLTIAEKISQLSGAIIKIIDSSPRITTYFAHSNKVRPSTRSHLVKVKLVNMQNERRAGNRSPLSQILQDYIKLGASRGKKILLFLNKKTESGHVYCRNCQYSEFAATAPEVCPNCQSPEIWFNSLNVNSLASLVRKIIPSAKVNIISQSTQLPNYPTTQPASPAGQLPTIDIATASVFYKLLLHKYDLVAHIQTDSLANITDFRSAEKLFAQITSLKKITRGLLLLQTYKAIDPTIVCAKDGNYQKFFQDQLLERRALSYPPFSLLVKLTLRGKKEENLEKKAQKLYQDLTTQLPNYPTTQLITILGPYKPQFTGKTAKYNIILKLPLKNYSLGQREMAIRAISPQLSLVKSGWQISKAFLRIEVEAESII